MSKDARTDSTVSPSAYGRGKFLSGLLTLVAVAVTFIAARWVYGPGSANAQAPRPGAPSKVAQSSSPRPKVGAPRPASANAVTPASAEKKVSGPPTQNLAVMAVVNGEQITRDQLANECIVRFGKDVLESIVNKHLIWQACQAQGVSVTDQDVQNEVARMASKFGLTTERWMAMLQEEREISPDQYRRDIIWPTLALRRLAANQIQVSKEELREAFEAEYGPQVKVRMIAVSSKAKADAIHKEVLAKPEQFGDIAKSKSEDPNSAAARGQIPPIRKHVGEPEVERAAFALKEGEVSPVIFAANQYLIIKCEKHLPESYVSSTQMEQIESRLRDQISDNKLRAAAATLFQKLQTESQVVNVLNDPQLSKQMPGVAATINKGQITMAQLAEECLQRHSKEVLEGEINRRILEQELKRRNKSISQADIDREISRAADSYGFIKPDQTPDIDAWLKAVTENEHVTVDLYLRDSVWPSVALKTIVGESIQVTKEDLDKGFVSNYGERVEVQAIVLSSQRQANQVWEMARNNPTEQFFGELAMQYSAEAVSRANSGRVPPIRKHGGQPVIEEEAFRLQPGELSGIIVVADKFVILRCLGRTQPVVNDASAVADELRRDIHEKKLRVAMAEEFDRVRESAQIDNFLAGTSQPGKRVAARSASGTAAAPPKAGVAPSRLASPAKNTKR